MAESNFNICELYCPSVESFEVLKELLKKFPVHIYNSLPEDIPTEPGDSSIMIIGWPYVKQYFPEHNILDKEINPKVFWTHEFGEKKEEFFDDVNKFVTNSIVDWLPSDHIEYDPFIEGDLSEFLKQNASPKSYMYVYHHLGALYLRSVEKDIILNLKSLEYVYDDVKNSLTEVFSDYRLLPFSCANIKEVFDIDKLKYITVENLFWIKHGVELEEKSFFDIIPGADYYKYVPYFLSLVTDLNLNDDEKGFLKRMKEKDIITNWLSEQEVCFQNAYENDSINFIRRDNKKFARFTYSNKRTLTGRLMSKDSFNIQNLPKDSPIRKEIVSRFSGGRILVCDYTSFETRISMFLTRDQKFIDEYNKKDIHYELGKSIFQKEEITVGERSTAKLLSHAMLYGASRKRLVEMLSNKMADPERGLYFAQEMMKPIIEYSNNLVEQVKSFGRIKTHKGSIVYPDKEFAAFNNLVQSTASEIMVDKLFEIQDLLKDKKSKFMFQIHDSLVFDIHPTEKKLIEDILKTLSKFNNAAFALGYRLGKNYDSLGEKKFFIFS